MCEIADEVREALKKFRFRKHDNNAALVCEFPRKFFFPASFFPHLFKI